MNISCSGTTACEFMHFNDGAATLELSEIEYLLFCPGDDARVKFKVYTTLRKAPFILRLDGENASRLLRMCRALWTQSGN